MILILQAVTVLLLSNLGAAPYQDHGPWAKETVRADTTAKKAAAANPPGSKLIRNNEIWHTVTPGGVPTSGEIYAYGGSIHYVSAGADKGYHWFGIKFSDVPNQRFKFEAVNHYFSADLADWQFKGVVIGPGMKNDSGSPVFPSPRFLGRTLVVWNPNDKLYVMAVMADEPAPVKRDRYMFFTAAAISGPWTHQEGKDLVYLPDEASPQVQHTLGGLGIFADGKEAYLCYTFDIRNEDGFLNKMQGIRKLDSHFTTPLPGPANYKEFDNRDQTQEATRMFKKGADYYLISSRTVGWKSSSTQYRTASRVLGDWSPRSEMPIVPNIVLHDADGPNTGADPNAYGYSFDTQNSQVIPIVSADGRAETYMYYGDRWSRFIEGADLSTGSYVFAPLTFDANFTPARPVINAPRYKVTGNANTPTGGHWLLNTVTGKWSTLNLLENAGFENPTLTGWTLNAGGTVLTDNGSKAVKLSANGANECTLTSELVTGCPSGSYTLKFAVKGAGAFTACKVAVFDGNVLLRSEALGALSSTNYESRIHTGIGVASGANLKIRVTVKGESGSYVLLDDFELIRN